MDLIPLNECFGNSSMYFMDAPHGFKRKFCISFRAIKIRKSSSDSRHHRFLDTRKLLTLLSQGLLLFSCSIMSHSVTPWTAARQAALSFTISRNLLKLMSTEHLSTSRLPVPPPGLSALLDLFMRFMVPAIPFQPYSLSARVR